MTTEFIRFVEELRFVKLFRGRGEYLLFVQPIAMRLTSCAVV